MTQSNVKQHLKKASNMSFGQIIGGITRLTGNTVSLGFKAIGATVYVADKAVSAGLQVGKAAYDETKKGYHQTDDIHHPTQSLNRPNVNPSKWTCLTRSNERRPLTRT